MTEYYTDGACSGARGKGGYAWVKLVDGVKVKEGGGYDENGTNSRMELMGVIAALSDFFENTTISKFMDDVIVYTDSAYVCNCYTEKWYMNWQKNGWRRANSYQPIANQDLWEVLIPYFNASYVQLRKVKGHSGKADWNDYVDRMAVKYKLSEGKELEFE